MTDKTFESVIEEHKKRTGAKYLHVTLGDKATPETLEKELIRSEQQISGYLDLPETFRLQCKIDLLIEHLREIGKSGRMTIEEHMSLCVKGKEMRDVILSHTDLIDVIDTGYALKKWKENGSD